MRRLGLVLGLVLAVSAVAEQKWKITPDSPEEKALLEIQGESDARKRLGMLDEFTKKFPSSEALPATFHIYQSAHLDTQEYDKSIEYGEKAADADTEDIAVRMNLVRAAQAKSDFARVHRWSAAVVPMLQKAAATKPSDMDDDDWKKRQETLKSYSDFVEYALFDALTRDNTAEKRKYVDAFAELFPQSERKKKLPGVMALVYQQANDVPNMVQWAEKAIAEDPENEAMLLVMAETNVGRKRLPDAQQLADRLLKVMETKKKPEGYADADWDKYMNAYRGAAYSVLGRSLMQQEKTAAAITELQKAVKLLEGNNDALAPALYNLGFGLAKLQRFAEARAVLNQSVKIGGPYAKLSRDTLAKMANR